MNAYIKRYQKDYLILITAIVLGFSISFLYWGLPPVRHSVLAVQTSVYLGKFPITIENFINKTDLTFGKPLGLPYLFYFMNMFVQLPDSLYFTSLLIGIIFSVSSFVLIHLHREELGKNRLLFLFIYLFNPWSLFHYYSLAPDGLYMILVNLFLIIHKIGKNSSFKYLSSALVVYLAIMVRLHGLILVPIWAILNYDFLKKNSELYKRDYVEFLILFFVLVLSYLGMNPLMNLTSNADGGRDDYLKLASSILSFNGYFSNLMQFLIFLFSTFGVFVFGLFPLKNINKRLLFIIAFVCLSLMVYRWTYHNTRYFFILTPFLGLIIFNKKNLYRKIFFITSLVVIILTNLLINFMPHRLLDVFDLPSLDNTLLDNVRLIEREREFENIKVYNEIDCKQSHCYIFSSYYGNAYYNFYENLSYFDKIPSRIYIESLEQISFKDEEFYIWLKDNESKDLNGKMRDYFPINKYEVIQIFDQIFKVNKK